MNEEAGSLTDSGSTAVVAPLSCMPLPLLPPTVVGGHEDGGMEEPETAVTSSSPRVAAAAAAAGESRSTTSIMSTDDGPDGPEGAAEWDIVDLIPDPEGAFMVAETRPPQAAPHFNC